MTQSQENWIHSIEKKNPTERINSANGPEKWRSLLFGCLPDPKLSASLGIAAKQCLCFFGPHGSGKHTLALGYAGSIMRNKYKILDSDFCQVNKYIHVTGRQLLDSGSETARSRVKDLFHLSFEGHYVLIIEEPSELCVWETIVDECRKLENSTSITVIVIESREDFIREEWQGALIFCRFDLPDYNERMTYFSRRLGKSNVRFPGNDLLADYTEGFNYYELDAFLNLMKLKLKQYLTVSYNSFSEVEAAANNGLVEFDESECAKCRSLVNAGRIEHDHTSEAIHVVIDGGGYMMPAMQLPAQASLGTDENKATGTENLLHEENDQDEHLRIELEALLISDLDDKFSQEGF